MSASNIQAILPLTSLQQGILYHTLESPDSGVYVGRFSCLLSGSFDADKWRGAWSQVTQRHDALRSLLTWEKREQPLQIVRDVVEPEIHELKIDAATAEDSQTLLAAMDRMLDGYPMKLDEAPLIRLAVARPAAGDVQFLLRFHHVILDGWSVRLIVNQALDIYNGNAPRDHADIGAQGFSDFVRWQKQLDHSAGLAWFENQLAGYEPITFPVLTNSSAATPHSRHPIYRRKLSASLSTTIKQRARDQRLTLNTIIVGAWSELLMRYLDTDDIVFGTTLAGRPLEPDMSEVAGLFINTLPMRVMADSDAPLAERLLAIQNDQSKMLQYQQTPLVDVLRQSHKALFDTIVVFENFPNAERSADAALAISNAAYSEFSHYPIALLAVPDEEIELLIVVDPAFVDQPAAERLLGHLEQLLIGMTAELDSAATNTTRKLPLLTSAEKKTLESWSRPADSCSNSDLTVWQLFVEQVGREPNATAISTGNERISYGELHALSAKIATGLLELGASRGCVVAVCLPRSIEAIAVFLAVIRLGAAYSPIDASAPIGRIQRLVDELRQSNGDLPTILVAFDDLSEVNSVKRISPMKLADNEGDFGLLDEKSPLPSDIAYVMFTSGSSGTPKGVAITHGNLARSTEARRSAYQAQPTGFLLLSSLATDSSVAGIYWSLIQGSELVLPGSREEQDPEAVARLIMSRSVTHMLLVPSLYALLLEYCDVQQLKSLRNVIVAGESCPPNLVSQHQQYLPDTQLFNEYGPTEATVWASVAQLKANQPISIGRPAAHSRLAIVDKQLRLKPAGLSGELIIGGAGIANGYLNDPQKTDEQFVPFAFDSEPPARWYRTGDRVCWNNDGSLKFLGRIDTQIKVRGFRVEPEEIEQLINNIDGVGAALVTLDSGDQLAAAVEPTTTDITAVKALLRESLPDHMVPRRIIAVANLPRTARGKLDRQRAASMDFGDDSSADSATFTEPRSDLEALIAEAWSAVLGMDELSVFDDFYEVGGDSLLSIRILAKLGGNGVQISANDFFSSPTVAGQAALARKSADESETADTSAGSVPLGPIQQWFCDRVGAQNTLWSQCRQYSIPASVDKEQLDAAVALLLGRHDALRLKFQADGTGAEQQLIAERDIDPVVIVDLDDVPDQHTLDHLASEATQSIDPKNAPLLRLTLIRSSANDLNQTLLISAHHWIIDALSFSLLETELGELLTHGPEANLADPSTPVSTWYRSQHAAAANLVSDADRAYWRNLTQSAQAHLPVEGKLAANVEGDVAEVRFSLSTERTRELLERVPAEFRIRAHELVLAAVASALTQWSGRSRITLDIEGHGRKPFLDNTDLSRTMGWLTIVYPLSLHLPPAITPGELLREAKERLREVPLDGASHGLWLMSDNEATRVKSDFCFNFFGRAAAPDAAQLVAEREHVGVCRQTDAQRAYLLELNVDAGGEQMTLNWRYCPQLHSETMMAQLNESVVANVDRLVAYCLSSSDKGTSPQDFPLADLDQSELSEIAELLGPGKDDI